MNLNHAIDYNRSRLALRPFLLALALLAIASIASAESGAEKDAFRLSWVAREDERARAERLPFFDGVDPRLASSEALWVLPEVLLSGEAVHTIGPDPARPDDFSQLLVTLTSEAAARFERLTAEGIGRQLAIVFEDQILIAPEVREAIPSGRVSIKGMNGPEVMLNILYALLEAHPEVHRRFRSVQVRITPGMKDEGGEFRPVSPGTEMTHALPSEGAVGLAVEVSYWGRPGKTLTIHTAEPAWDFRLVVEGVDYFRQPVDRESQTPSPSIELPAGQTHAGMWLPLWPAERPWHHMNNRGELGEVLELTPEPQTLHVEFSPEFQAFYRSNAIMVKTKAAAGP